MSMRCAASILAALATLRPSSATVLDNLDQGSVFTQCISISDWNTMSMADDITLIDRDSTTGCCPSGSVAGQTFYNQYEGAQVTCGWKSDGTISVSTGSTCNYNTCYIQKQNLPCSDGSTQLINGCCGSTQSSRTFESTCTAYDYTMYNAHSEPAEYCLTFHQNWGTIGNSGTSSATDDQADGMLVVDNVYHYAECEGGAGSGGVASGSVASAVFGLTPLLIVASFM